MWIDLTLAVIYVIIILMIPVLMLWWSNKSGQK
jgi:nitrogen fixation-related uncharacterized protein